MEIYFKFFFLIIGKFILFFLFFFILIFYDILGIIGLIKIKNCNNILEKKFNHCKSDYFIEKKNKKNLKNNITFTTIRNN